MGILTGLSDAPIFAPPEPPGAIAAAVQQVSLPVAAKTDQLTGMLGPVNAALSHAMGVTNAKGAEADHTAGDLDRANPGSDTLEAGNILTGPDVGMLIEGTWPGHPGDQPNEPPGSYLYPPIDDTARNVPPGVDGIEGRGPRWNDDGGKEWPEGPEIPPHYPPPGEPPGAPPPTAPPGGGLPPPPTHPTPPPKPPLPPLPKRPGGKGEDKEP